MPDMSDSSTIQLHRWAAWVTGRKAEEIRTVDFDSDTRWSGGCETCGWDETYHTVNIWFIGGGYKEFEFDSIYDLIATVTQEVPDE